MDINLQKHKEDLLFTPLGGASEIGMNVNLYHLDGKWLMVDLGLGFAHEVPGIDMLAPDISFIKAHKKNLLGLIITHIHEDHLGSVQHLWEELKMPIYTSNLTANFLKAKLAEYPFAKEVKIIVIDKQKELDLDPFKIEFIGLTHSVPEMNALLIKTKHGNILHSGDWKFDPDPVVGNVSEKEVIKSYGDKGEILALVCDSTNALSPGRSRSEGELFESLRELVKDAKNMVGIATFASNIARISTICEVARSCGRKVVLAGFSLRRIVEVGQKSGYFKKLPPFISENEIKFYDKSEILVLCTGCQGEPNAATMKIATDSHRNIRFSANDLIIFSSKIIPGNEKSIFELFDLFAKKKVEVVTEKDHFVHVSGHPNQDELREMYELAKPQIAVPVHGQFIHTRGHCTIAKESGAKQVVQVQNGSVVKLSKTDCKIIGSVPTGYFGVDGTRLIPIKGRIIKQRYILENAGVVFVNVILDKTGHLLAKPHLKAIGIYDFDSEPQTFEIIIDEIVKSLRNSQKELGFYDSVKNKFFGNNKKKKSKNTHKIHTSIEKSVNSVIKKAFFELTGKKPLTEISVNIV